MDEAKKIHYRLMEYIDLLFQDGSPSGIKAALDIMGICENNLRLPLVKVNKALNNQLRQAIEAMNENDL
jgi:4-hydroxy-tetrahydrodipicolinate synthase